MRIFRTQRSRALISAGVVGAGFTGMYVEMFGVVVGLAVISAISIPFGLGYALLNWISRGEP